MENPNFGNLETSVYSHGWEDSALVQKMASDFLVNNNTLHEDQYKIMDKISGGAIYPVGNISYSTNTLAYNSRIPAFFTSDYQEEIHMPIMSRDRKHFPENPEDIHMPIMSRDRRHRDLD